MLYTSPPPCSLALEALNSMLCPTRFAYTSQKEQITGHDWKGHDCPPKGNLSIGAVHLAPTTLTDSLKHNLTHLTTTALTAMLPPSTKFAHMPVRYETTLNNHDCLEADLSSGAVQLASTTLTDPSKHDLTYFIITALTAMLLPSTKFACMSVKYWTTPNRHDCPSLRA